MSYYALLSVFPAAIVLAAVAGLVLDDPAARQDVVDFLFDELPLSETDGRSDIESLVNGVTEQRGHARGDRPHRPADLGERSRRRDAQLGRRDLRGDCSRGALRGKGLDLLLVLGLGLLFALSFAATLLGQFEPDLGDGVLQRDRDVLTATGSLAADRAQRDRLRGALHGASGRRARGSATSGRRSSSPRSATSSSSAASRSTSTTSPTTAPSTARSGAVVAFMVFVYIASIVFLFGAEMAALWPEVQARRARPRRDDDDDEAVEDLRRGGPRLRSRASSAATRPESTRSAAMSRLARPAVACADARGRTDQRALPPRDPRRRDHARSRSRPPCSG